MQIIRNVILMQAIHLSKILAFMIYESYMATRQHQISREVCVSAEQFLCERGTAEINVGKKPNMLLSLKRFIPE